jgi:ABC-type transporter Mla subunit MlaD
MESQSQAPGIKTAFPTKRLAGRSLFPLLCLLAASCNRSPQRLLLVEFERIDEIHKGTELRYRGVPAGRVDSVSLTGPHNLPVAKVSLSPEAPAFTSADEFGVTSTSLLGDPFIDVIPAVTPGTPLPNGAQVRAQTPNLVHLDDPAQIAKTLGNLDLVKDLLDLPEPKRAEVLAKIRKLIDDAKSDAHPSAK